MSCQHLSNNSRRDVFAGYCIILLASSLFGLILPRTFPMCISALYPAGTERKIYSHTSSERYIHYWFSQFKIMYWSWVPSDWFEYPISRPVVELNRAGLPLACPCYFSGGGCLPSPARVHPLEVTQADAAADPVSLLVDIYTRGAALWRHSEVLCCKLG